jgi:RNA-directed DNA polymerase
MADVFSGRQSHRGKSQTPRSLDGRRETKQRTALLQRLREVFRRCRSQPLGRVIAVINPILRGWVNYFRVGNAARCFGFVKEWVERRYGVI